MATLKTTKHLLILTTIFLPLLTGCLSSKNINNSTQANQYAESPQETKELIKLNQLGYPTKAIKTAIIPDVISTSFNLIDIETDTEVYSGALSTTKQWDLAGSEKFKQANFSDFTKKGNYKISVAGVADSSVFAIEDSIYQALHKSALKSYYYGRSSTELLPIHAGKWARPAGHLDQKVIVHSSASTISRPAGTVISSPKGWYDAGDYGKYIVNSGIATYTMLAAYEHHPQLYNNLQLNIPESTDNIPDIINEIKWNLDWMVTMQDEDGSVYHKLTTLGWPGKEMPHKDTRQRYLIGKSTSAAYDFSATMAAASRVYSQFESQYPGISQKWLNAAVKAWQWANKNPNLSYKQPSDVSSGEYGDNNFSDEKKWAAAELFLATEQQQYLSVFTQGQSKISVPNWSQVEALGYISLSKNGKNSLSKNTYQQINTNIITLANTITDQFNNSTYLVPMVESDFVWGSNAVAANKALILNRAFQLTKQVEYKNIMAEILSYLLGRNPTDYSFITGFGNTPPMHIHHRPSESDDITQPIPGFLAGGPQNGQQDKCNYPANTPAKSYVDDWCSYASNEIAINWNAPLVYLLAAITNK